MTDLSRFSSSRSAAKASVSTLSSGMTAFKSIALRTADNASLGRTANAGGGRLPILCKAASTSARTSRRAISESRTASSFSPRLISRRSVSVSSVSSPLIVSDVEIIFALSVSRSRSSALISRVIAAWRSLDISMSLERAASSCSRSFLRSTNASTSEASAPGGFVDSSRLSLETAGLGSSRPATNRALKNDPDIRHFPSPGRTAVMRSGVKLPKLPKVTL